MLARERIASSWSGIDVGGFGPYQESLAAVVAEKAWTDPLFRAELVASPRAVLAREIGLDLPAGCELVLIQKRPDEFVFVLPDIPAAEDLWYRYEQISGWWMLAHANWWWMARQFGSHKVSSFLPALDVQIIGRSWSDPAWRAALLDHPRTALEGALGAAFPPGLAIRAVADTARLVHLVLPTRPEQEDVEAAAEHLGGLFAISHTWWQWLVYPRLLRPANPAAVTAMVG